MALGLVLYEYRREAEGVKFFRIVKPVNFGALVSALGPRLADITNDVW